jgi:N utilization substance protein B
LYAALLQNISAEEALLMTSQSNFEKPETLEDKLTLALLQAADEHSARIETLTVEALSRPLTQLSDIEQVIIRAATAELLVFPLTSHRVVIDEAIEIAKQFGAEGGYKIVNGTLNAIAIKLRNNHAGKVSDGTVENKESNDILEDDNA